MDKECVGKPSEGQRSLRKVEDESVLALAYTADAVIKTGSVELRYYPDEVVVIHKEHTPKSPLERGDEGVFEVDVSSIARSLGRRIATLIAKGIVQDHYEGDWSRVRFIGLGEEVNKIRVLPLNPPPKGDKREESIAPTLKHGVEKNTPLNPLLIEGTAGATV